VSIAESAKKQAARYEVNAAFNQATLHFADGSLLQQPLGEGFSRRHHRG
jgi:hypothetical protein